MRKGCKYATAANITQKEILPKPSIDWDAQKFTVAPVPTEKLIKTQEGDVFNLGNGRLLTVIELPGHSQGSIGLLRYCF